MNPASRFKQVDEQTTESKAHENVISKSLGCLSQRTSRSPIWTTVHSQFNSHNPTQLGNPEERPLKSSNKDVKSPNGWSSKMISY
jgi:hypothetical protein